jgi:DNA topoisomerase 2-associated protein PAT1
MVGICPLGYNILRTQMCFREENYQKETAHQWDVLRVMVPLEACNPHPFISLMIPAKGKKLLPRITRHLQSNQILQIICLLVACFSQLDVVRNAALLDMEVGSPERAEVETQTELFLSTVLQCILPVISQFNIGVLGGMMGLMMEHGDMGLIVHSRVSIFPFSTTGSG